MHDAPIIAREVAARFAAEVAPTLPAVVDRLLAEQRRPMPRGVPVEEFAWLLVEVAWLTPGMTAHEGFPVGSDFADLIMLKLPRDRTEPDGRLHAMIWAMIDAMGRRVAA
ncbi:MAG: hypothetical protein KC620_19505 [Myxococcales bacterium]|nr:hypothetical protein [Myxococcales bacterium]